MLFRKKPKTDTDFWSKGENKTLGYNSVFNGAKFLGQTVFRNVSFSLASFDSVTFEERLFLFKLSFF